MATADNIIKLTEDKGMPPESSLPSTSQSSPSPAAVFERRDPVKTLAMQPRIVEVLSTIFDPEIPVNIYELGLIYEIAVDPSDVAGVRMTLTSPGCPAAQSLPGEVARKLKEIPGLSDVKVDVVWDPPWDKDRMSETAKLQLGIF